MNKFLSKFFGVFFVSILALSFSSCGNDTIEDLNKEDKVTFIGTWKYAFGEGAYTLIKIEDNNTAFFSEWEGFWERKDVKYTYIYDASDNILYFYDADGCLEIELQIISLTYTTMKAKAYVNDGPNGEILKFIRQ